MLIKSLFLDILAKSSIRRKSPPELAYNKVASNEPEHLSPRKLLLDQSPNRCVWVTRSKATSSILLLTLFQSSLSLASTRVETIESLILQSTTAMLSQLPLIADERSASPFLSLVEKEIAWAPGIRWRQQYLNLGASRFPVVWLEVDPRTSGVSLRPIWSNPATQVGSAPLTQTAQLWQASAAINAGFFNRKEQLPLGAIRRDGRWLSGPILNRGAIAWNNTGQFKFGRLSLQETLITSAGVRLPILFLNSGYVQSGIAHYTPDWGPTYTPLTDNEVLVFVQNNQVTAQMPGGIAGQRAFPIPTNGYLLTLRANSTSAAKFFNVGTPVGIEQSTTPPDFARYPHILGAGPLLLQNQQIVLDAKGEQFTDAFIQQSAIRSCIGITASGTLIIAAIHSRVSGRGPSLTETAQLTQQLGAINALNLDGGSSTGLYLGGQLLDRSSYTAAKVHNGIGIFRPFLP